MDKPTSYYVEGENLSGASLELVAHERIAVLRRARHMTPLELAEAVGISRPYVSMIENGKVGRMSQQRGSKLAEVLGVERSELFRVVA